MGTANVARLTFSMVATTDSELEELYESWMYPGFREQVDEAHAALGFDDIDLRPSVIRVIAEQWGLV